MNSQHWGRAGLLLVVVIAASIVCGQDAMKLPGAGGAASLTNVDSRASDILRSMADCLAAAREFSFQAYDMMDQILENGQKVQVSLEQRIVVRRPNRIYAEANGDLEEGRYWYNGRSLTMLDVADNVYATIEVPDTIDKMFDFIAEKYALTLPLSDLVFSNTYEAVAPQIRGGFYVGLHRVRGVKCHHLAFRQEAVDWQIWVDAGDPPLPRKLVITYKEIPGDPQYIAFFDNWNLDDRLAESTFEFSAPLGAKKTELTPGRKQIGDVESAQTPTAPKQPG